MSVEIPKQCQNCPRSCGLQEAHKQLETQEDMMIQAYMDDAIDNQFADVQFINQSESENEEPESVEMATIARAILNAQIDAVKQGKEEIEKIAEHVTSECIGAVTLKQTIDEVDYEVSLCRSEAERDHITSPPLEGPNGTHFDIALVRREPEATPDTESEES